MMITSISYSVTNINEEEVLRKAFSTNDSLSWREMAKTNIVGVGKHIVL